jgi:serine/threonine-protein kinase PpkA
MARRHVAAYNPARMSAPVSLPAFDVPGHRLVRRLGRGGMATVYLAIQTALRRPVAVKVLIAPNEEAVSRFEQEARTIARLDHPHIVSIHQIGRTSDGQLFYTMPYLPNGDLSRRNLRQKPLRVAAVLRSLLDALGYAHAQGIVHRDVKPENVLFDKHGRVLLADFGIARTSGMDLRVTREGTPIGSTGYMSPEQARGQPIDGRSDLYSMGVLAYEMLTGELPFSGNDALSTAIAHIEQKVPRLPPMMRAWQPWIDKALAKAPTDRFQSAAEMADALGMIDGRSVARRASRSRNARARRGTWAAAGILVLILAGMVGIVMRRQSYPVFGSDIRPVVSAAPANGATTSLPAVLPPASAAASTAPAAAAPAFTAPSEIDRAAASLVAEGDILRGRGRLTKPPGNNAALRYLAALKLDPDNAAALGAVHDALAVLQREIDDAMKRGDAWRIDNIVMLGDRLAAAADQPTRRSWNQARRRLAARVGVIAADAVQARDAQQLANWKLLAKTLPATYPAGFAAARIDQPLPPPAPLPDHVPHAGMLLRDPGGPELVYVPASGKAPAFAIGRDEITRDEYAAFARATGRPVSACLEAHNPFSRLRSLTWRSPGFPQSGRHPVVCVSWKDAAAYVAWLSKRTGQPYRLPDDRQWLRAAQGVPGGTACQRGDVDDASRKTAFDNDRWPCSDGAAQTAPVGHYEATGMGAFDMYGNVSEWLSGGSAGERWFRGLSWRDGSHQTPLGTKGDADSSVGYTSVGFRVLREIDAAHPPPVRGSTPGAIRATPPAQAGPTTGNA